MRFEILGDISNIETFAAGSQIREIARLRRIYGRGRWRKRKGVARVRLTDGAICLAKYIGMKRPDSDARNSKSSTCFDIMARSLTKQFVVCIDNEGYAASLEKRKIYLALSDRDAERHGLMRIIDESGDDYLYPKTFFRPIALPQSVKRALLAAA